MPLIHLIYASAATAPFDQTALQNLLQQSRDANLKANITGMLLHVDGSFFQVLEGEAEAVERLFEKIRKDTRHDHVTIIIREAVARRAFTAWTMGYANVTSEEVRSLIGLNDFFGSRTCLEGLDNGRARKLLAAFAHGRWHTRIGHSVSAA